MTGARIGRRILHVDHTVVLGGAERSVTALARSQLRLGHDVLVAVGGPGPFLAELERQGVPAIELGWSHRFRTASGQGGPRAAANTLVALPGAALALRRLLRRWRPDIVHAHTRKAQLAAVAATVGMGQMLVWHLRDDVPAGTALRVGLRLLIRRADHAVALSRWLVESYRAAGYMPRSRRLGVVPSGVDQLALQALDRPWLDGRRRPPVVGFVGQIARWKAPHLLVEAAEAMPDSDALFRIVGGVMFPESEAEYGVWLGRRIAVSPAAGRVVWSGPAADPAAAFAQLDILAHTSTSPEPFGRVLVEAMAAGRPIVAFRLGSPVELLDDESARFAERPDGPALAVALRGLLADPSAGAELAARGRERALAFEPDVVAAMMDAEYARVAPP